MRLRSKPGHCFISPDPITEAIAGSKFGLIAPSAVYDPGMQKPRSMWVVPKTGIVVYHAVTSGWVSQGEADLTGKRVIFDRWAAVPLPPLTWTDGKEYSFLSISQWAILAVLENEGDGK